MNGLELLAKHFSHTCGVTLILKEGIVPCADLQNKVIYLPSNLAESSRNAVRAWVMHESGHIRWSSPFELHGQGYLAAFVNVLDDIRVDGLIFREYPAVKDCLFRHAVSEAVGRPGYWAALPRPEKLCVALILREEGFAEYLPNDAEIRDFFCRHGRRLEQIMLSTRSAADTSSLVGLAQKLARLILGRAALARMKSLLHQLQVALQELESVDGATEEVKQNERNLRRRIQYHRRRTPGQPSQRASSSGKGADACSPSSSEEEQRDIREARKALDEHRAEATARVAAVKEQARVENDDLTRAVGQHPDLLAPDRSSLQYQDVHVSSPALDRLLLARLRESRGRQAPGPAQLDPRKLHALYTDPERIFSTRRKVSGKWKRMFFLLDCSGSMSGSKARMVCHVMTELGRSLERCRARTGSGASLQYEIWTFNETATRIKAQDEPFTEDVIRRYRAGGGTALSSALEAVSKAISHSGRSDSRHNVLFCLTDAEVEERDLLAARSFRGAKAIFLGIETEQRLMQRPEAQRIRNELFLRHNLTTPDLLEKVLQEALLHVLGN